MSKFNEETMLEALSALTGAGETIEAAVYCSFRQTGFFASSARVNVGYVAITDKGRLLAIRTGLVDSSTTAFDLDALTKRKISNAIFGQKLVDLIFYGDKKTEQKFQIAPKIGGKGFPNHAANLETFLHLLEEQEIAE